MSQTEDLLTLEDLFAVVEGRQGADPESSWTAQLLHRGTDKIAQKLGEEAVEVVIEAVRHNRPNLIAESADLLYHLLVLWVDQGVRPEDVLTELAGRRGVSGLDEKKIRKAKQSQERGT